MAYMIFLAHCADETTGQEFSMEIEAPDLGSANEILNGEYPHLEILDVTPKG